MPEFNSSFFSRFAYAVSFLMACWAIVGFALALNADSWANFGIVQRIFEIMSIFMAVCTIVLVLPHLFDAQNKPWFVCMLIAISIVVLSVMSLFGPVTVTEAKNEGAIFGLVLLAGAICLFFPNLTVRARSHARLS